MEEEKAEIVSALSANDVGKKGDSRREEGPTETSEAGNV